MATPSWTLQLLKIKDLRSHPRNPRTLSKHQAVHLKQSLARFGCIDKPIVTLDSMVIGGHQRLKMLKQLKYKEIECWVPDRDLSELEIDELNIRLNQNQGSWDFDILANEWDVEKLIDWGFNPEDFDISSGVEEEGGESGELLPPENPKTKPGDLYELGEHRLLCGSSIEADDVKKLLAGEVPLLMVTDPPYGVNYDASWRCKRNKSRIAAGKVKVALGKVKNDHIVDWKEAYDLFPGNVAYVWCASLFSSEVQKNLEDSDFGIKNLIIWVKDRLILSRGDYHWKHETCWYAVRNGKTHNWQGSRKETTVWEIASNSGGGGFKEDGEERTAHSTQKPEECMRRPIVNNSAVGDWVYDPFCGSGTTLIAAQKTRRKALCMELDPAYCDIIVDRYVNYCKMVGDECVIRLNGESVDDRR